MAKLGERQPSQLARVQCDATIGGCGWWWYRRRAGRRYEYDGAHYGNDGHPEPHPLRGRWLTEAELNDQYGDCVPHLRDVPL